MIMLLHVFETYIIFVSGSKEKVPVGNNEIFENHQSL